VPEDIEDAASRTELAPLPTSTRPEPDEPSPSQIERAAAVLNGAATAHRPGRPRSGPVGAADALRHFSEQLGLPVATTFHGKGVFPDDHPHSLGTSGS
jgi:acetolactate synthase-1/2/3 large subunit